MPEDNQLSKKPIKKKKRSERAIQDEYTKKEEERKKKEATIKHHVDSEKTNGLEIETNMEFTMAATTYSDAAGTKAEEALIAHKMDLGIKSAKLRYKKSNKEEGQMIGGAGTVRRLYYQVDCS